MTKLAPSILSANFAYLAQEINEATQAEIDYLHIDVMDGHFVPNLTIGPLVIHALKSITSLPLDVHLMMTHPERYLQQFQEAGSYFISVHVEACPHLHRIITQIKQLGCLAGVAINPATSLHTLDQILESIDRVIVMSVNPGFGGQSFITSSLSKIESLARTKINRKLDFEIEVDGGVNCDNAKQLVQAGADVLVAGSEIFNDQDSIKNNIKKIRNSLL